MNKSRAFSKLLMTILITTIILYLSLVVTGALTISTSHAIVICLTLFLVFAFGLFIISPGLNQGPEKFVLRFLVLTTFQLISAMSILLAFVVAKQQDLKILCFHFISLFVFLLIFQSVFLVRINNKS